MISLTVNSFARYLLIEDDPRVKRLIVETVDDLVEHHLGPDGVGMYKELPSLQFSNPTMHFVEALAHAYRITGDERYLRVATRQFAAFEESVHSNLVAPKRADDSGAVIYGEGGGRQFDDKYTSLILYAAAAAPKGFLNWFEYPILRSMSMTKSNRRFPLGIRTEDLQRPGQRRHDAPVDRL